MCGIAGVFDPTDAPDEELLRRMNDCQTHRGPDDRGVYRDGPVGFAHRRLSVIGLESGRQPIFNEDGSVAVVFNGELYNYRSIRESLRSRGHRFETDTDTEVLVHLYEEEGLELVERLDGMFAFALWDADRGRLVLARDRMGIKPLVVASDDEGRFAFGSEIPAVLESGVEPGGLDRTAMARYFAFGFVPAPHTPFRNVRKLRPGAMAILTSEGMRRERFYAPSVSPESPPSLDAAATELRSRVEAAVERRLVSDVPLGAFLSGGIDSSVVVGTMASLSETPVRTFTVGFDEALFDESRAAREVADYHDTRHREFTVSPADVREVVPEVVDAIGEPFADPSLLPTYVVSRETSDEVKVALSGDGADELFAGYEKYRGEYFSRYYRAIPGPVRSRVVEPAVDRLPASRGNDLGEVARKAQKFVRGGVESVPDRHFEWIRLPDDRTTGAFDAANPVASGRADLAERHAEAESFLPRARRDPLARMQAVDTFHSLPNQMLRKVDRASMYNSLEVRVPFLDTGVVEYAMGLPTEYKITASDRKRVLKRAFADVLPDSILDRPKRGFDVPIGEWLKRDFAAEFRRTVETVETDLFDARAVLDVFEEHVHGARDHTRFLWSVYVFARWLDRMRARGVLSE
ncbi:asparagine synthase (glutamine-hydrolyzing) [Halorussus caseinilyticus]|uniref:Putative asparagine synthetase [glutamine-hydrolyzing] n=1 Tax=Halorussus caseinilyticus TaxID=3034025 RepID=A0ABD5WRC3_9EURY|nr:asparagine synthase (glutamine-hydrolyzing) [Halorussus sp. DT72]